MTPDDFKHTISLYRPITETDPLRSIGQASLELIGTFKAAIEPISFTQPQDQIAQIYYLHKIHLRVSSFYRYEFIKNNIIEHNTNYMRIASVIYDRMTGITTLQCYDIPPPL